MTPSNDDDRSQEEEERVREILRPQSDEDRQNKREAMEAAEKQRAEATGELRGQPRNSVCVRLTDHLGGPESAVAAKPDRFGT